MPVATGIGAARMFFRPRSNDCNSTESQTAQVGRRHRARLVHAEHRRGKRLIEWNDERRKRLAIGGKRQKSFGTIGRDMASNQHAVIRSRRTNEEAKQMPHGIRQWNGIVEGRRGLHERQNLLDGLSELKQSLHEFAMSFRWNNSFELSANGGEERIAIQILILVEIIADAHAQRVERRRLMGEPGDQDRHEVRMEFHQIFE